jgi:hypothetical protein
MIKEIEKSHGVVLYRLIKQNSNGVLIAPIEEFGTGFFCVNTVFALSIKYSTSRLSPWKFSFTSEQRDQLARLNSQFASPSLALVCGQDGLAIIEYSEWLDLTNDDQCKTLWIRVSRRKNEMYSITGSSGSLSQKIADGEFRKISNGRN